MPIYRHADRATVALEQLKKVLELDENQVELTLVFTERKRVEKLRYMHRNPVQRGLVLKPEEWLWSSFRHYTYGEGGPVLVNETRKAELHIRKIS
jgi:hypothetical protein